MAEPRDRTALMMILAVLGGLFVCMVAGVFLLSFGYFFFRTTSAPSAFPAPPVMVVPDEDPLVPVENPLIPGDDPPQKVPAPRKNIPTH